MLYGAIEAGGTKFVVSVGDQNYKIIDRVSFPTTDPEETMKQVVDFLDKYDIVSLGVGSFGPVDLNPDSKTYGYILNTPKTKWRQFNLLGYLKDRMDIPMAITTDVNASAKGENVFGHGKDKKSIVYYTFGTGVGGGAIYDDKFLQGFSHPEMGHMSIKRHPQDSFEGFCVSHKDCLEGLASGPSIEARKGMPAVEIPIEDPVWDFEANYIAQCAMNTTLVLMPDIIVLGGGVMKKPGLIEKVRTEFERMFANYVDLPDLNDYLQLPALGDNAAVMGCFAMAEEMIKNQ